MQDTNYTGRKTVRSEQEKHEVLHRLADMFNCPPERLRSLCEEHEWNVEECIDHLISSNQNAERAAGARLNTNWYKNKVHGAIPKYNSSQPQMQRNTISQNKVGRNQNGNHIQNAKTNNNNNYISNINASTIELRIVKQIDTGSKIMVILRGVPGSGKSYLAKSILERCALLNEQYTLKEFVFSTDDFFYDNFGRYKFNGAQLSEAHEWNQQRVRERAEAGWSPILVDNTNMQLWEMMAYVRIAVQNGYVIELLEPKTPWRNSARKLAAKNKHGVPVESIQGMLDRYEKATVGDLLKMLKETRYTVSLPQMRTNPPFSINQNDTETDEVFQIFEAGSGDKAIETNQLRTIKQPASSYSMRNEPKAQRENNRVKIGISTSNAWTPHEEEIKQFWGIDPPKAHTGTLLDLLKEGVNEPRETSQEPKDLKVTEESIKRQLTFKRHSINCPNENKAFASLRQIYPNKEIGALWDLFVKCSGDIDWAVDILLKEDELLNEQSEYFASANEEADAFQCNCESEESPTNNAPAPQPLGSAVPLGPTIKPQRPRARILRTNQRPNNNDLQEVKEIIENRFKIGNEHYSPHVRNLREMREKLLNTPTKTYADVEIQTDLPEEEQEDEEVNEIVEIALGDGLVGQLRSIFDAETATFGERLSDNLTMNVFMPRSLAKELYMLWVESAYNYLEEQRQQTLRDDEHFARLLKNPKYENYIQSPNNIQELLDEELGWKMYKNEEEQSKGAQQQDQPTDLAAYLTQMKLCEVFPNIPRETLVEILSAHGNSYEETVKVLKNTMNPAQNLTVENINEELLQFSLRDKEMHQHPQDKNIAYPEGTVSSIERGPKLLLQPEEAKRLALHDFEEMRNLAAHHCQLKAECYQKAKEAIQKGNSAVAVYYSQIANLHKMKIDMYNHRAANCIMDVHKYTQNNPELLDLHYLHVMEAVGCLDLFLDRHITGLRAQSRSYKHVFIITGRGLHSAGGVSTIKNKVKSRLKERNLRWCEVNPGLLKVKIFSASRHSKNI